MNPSESGESTQNQKIELWCRSINEVPQSRSALAPGLRRLEVVGSLARVRRPMKPLVRLDIKCVYTLDRE